MKKLDVTIFPFNFIRLWEHHLILLSMQMPSQSSGALESLFSRPSIWYIRNPVYCTVNCSRAVLQFRISLLSMMKLPVPNVYTFNSTQVSINLSNLHFYRTAQISWTWWRPAKYCTQLHAYYSGPSYRLRLVVREGSLQKTQQFSTLFLQWHQPISALRVAGYAVLAMWCKLPFDYYSQARSVRALGITLAVLG